MLGYAESEHIMLHCKLAN